MQDATVATCRNISRRVVRDQVTISAITHKTYFLQFSRRMRRGAISIFLLNTLPAGRALGEAHDVVAKDFPTGDWAIWERVVRENAGMGFNMSKFGPKGTAEVIRLYRRSLDSASTSHPPPSALYNAIKFVAIVRSLSASALSDNRSDRCADSTFKKSVCPC